MSLDGNALLSGDTLASPETGVAADNIYNGQECASKHLVYHDISQFQRFRVKIVCFC